MGFLFYFCMFVFLAALRSMWDLSSPDQGLSRVLFSGSMES